MFGNLPIKIRTVSIVYITMLTFFLGINVETWHTHTHARDTQKSENESHSNSSEQDQCPLCSFHITKDILTEETNVVFVESEYRQENTLLPYKYYSQPTYHYSVRGPPVLL